jgi:hypothetical protein
MARPSLARHSLEACYNKPVQTQRPRRRLLRGAVGLGLALTLHGCSEAEGDGKPSGGHAPLPQVIYQGGGVLAAPNVITVTFPGDPLATQLAAFGKSVASSSYWHTETASYCETPGAACVGDGPAGTAVALTTPPATSYTDSVSGGPSSLQTWLTTAITSGVLPMPDKNPVTNTIYALYFPSSTTITLDGTASCADTGFDGYHNSMAMGSQQIVYAVINECSPIPAPFPSIVTPSLLQATTMTASHEIVESATDPDADPSAPYGYFLDTTNPSNRGWLDVAGGEIADLCLDLFNMNQDQTTDGTFTVQRIWSNTQAGSGVDPCNPIPSGETYFNAAPRQSVVVVGVGAQATFAVDAFSTAPAASWTLTAQDWTNAPATYLTFSIAGSTQTRNGPQIAVKSGSTVEVTVTLALDPSPLATSEADGVIVSLSGDPSNPTAAHYWPFVVMTPADAMDAGVPLTGKSGRVPGRLRVHERQRTHTRH